MNRLAQIKPRYTALKETPAGLEVVKRDNNFNIARQAAVNCNGYVGYYSQAVGEYVIYKPGRLEDEQ